MFAAPLGSYLATRLLGTPSTTTAMTYRRGKAPRRVYRRTGGRKRRSTAVQKVVKRALQYTNELKSIDFTVNFSSTALSNGINYIIPIVQGTTGSSRTGRQIRVSMIELNFTAGVNVATGATAPNNDVYRFHVISDHQSNGAAPARTDIWTAVTYAGYHKNTDNLRRFTHLYDSGVKEVNQVMQASAAGSFQYTHHNVRVPCDVLVSYYNSGNAGTIADCEKNGLFFIAGSLNSLVAFQGYVRVWFRDI